MIRRPRSAKAPGAAVLLAATLLLTACGGGHHQERTSWPAPPRVPSPSASTTGPGQPSHAATLICSAQTVQDLTDALGAPPSPRPAPTWKRATRAYSCPYRYTRGAVMTLTVRDAASPAAARTLFAARRAATAHAATLPNMGQQAFTAPDSSVTVRKDASVLTVDVSRLPATFGTPARSRADVAKLVATTVLICWKQY
jgi:hypothetical protein